MGSADLASVSPITEALTPAEADRLLKRAVHRTLASGERLYLAGERNARVHLLSSGALKLMASNPGGRRRS
jgi:CRP-like cAMP-binding protein